ncbi:MAG: TolC family protein [Flavobacteriia bacterium]|nr:TolC family protein [Flavobacteriia bacterium]
MKNIRMLWISLLSFAQISAQSENWSLQKCLEIGLQNNLELKCKMLEIEKSKTSHTSQLMNWLPNINIYTDHTYNFGSTIDPATNNRVTSNYQYDYLNLGAHINLFDLYSIQKTQKETIEIAINDLDYQRIVKAYQMLIVKHYMESLLTQKLLSIQIEQIQNTKKEVNRIEKEVANGNKAKSDLYEIQLIAANEETHKLETEQLFEQQKLNLFQLLQVTVKNIKFIQLEFTISHTTASTTTINDNHLELKIVELRLLSNQKLLSMNRALKFPTIQTFYNISSFYYQPLSTNFNGGNQFQTQLNNNKNQLIGLRMNIPVFNGFKTEKLIQCAKIESEKIKLEREQMKQKLDNQIMLKITQLEQQIAKQQQLETNLMLTKEVYRTTQSKYTRGIIEVSLFTLTKNQLLIAELDVLKNQILIQFIQNELEIMK